MQPDSFTRVPVGVPAHKSLESATPSPSSSPSSPGGFPMYVTPPKPIFRPSKKARLLSYLSSL